MKLLMLLPDENYESPKRSLKVIKTVKRAKSCEPRARNYFLPDKGLVHIRDKKQRLQYAYHYRKLFATQFAK